MGKYSRQAFIMGFLGAIAYTAYKFMAGAAEAAAQKNSGPWEKSSAEIAEEIIRISRARARASQG